MEATKCLFPVFLFMSMLATTSTADRHGWLIPRPRPWPKDPACLSGQAFPFYALPRCRAYLARKCVSEWVVEPVRQECCRQLAAVHEPGCKCPAIRHMLESMFRGLGVEGGKHQQEVAARLPTVCGQEVPLSGSVCSWATANRWRA
ncbi:unnamed protein product [Alopecurus aequalis]